MSKTFIFQKELQERLRKIYGLEGLPKDLDEFSAMLRARSQRQPNIRQFIERVKAGEAVIGRCGHSTRNSIFLKTGQGVYVACSYDALMTALLQGEAAIESSCPHCKEKMKITIKSGRLVSYHPNSIIFWWGTGPKGSLGHPVCDHIHFFPSKEHLNSWLASNEGEMGFSLKLEGAAAFLSRGL